MHGPDLIIPDFPKLLKSVLDAWPNRNSALHGEGHWKCVAWTGLELAPRVPGAEPLVVLLFGLLHDSQRHDDGADLAHGRRAAAWTEQSQGQLYHLNPRQVRLLADACHDHVEGRTSDDPTIGLCWDADRLNLWRIGLRPDPRLLSTPAAREEQTIQRAAHLSGQHLDWPLIHAACRRLGP